MAGKEHDRDVTFADLLGEGMNAVHHRVAIEILTAHDDKTELLERVADCARVVHCPDWELGPGASLRCGLAALAPGTAAVVVALADGPDLAPAAVDRVVSAWRNGAGQVVAASYDGRRGHPIVLDRAVWASIPDEGARAFEPVLVPCDDLGAPGDVDRPDDLPERFS